MRSAVQCRHQAPSEPRVAGRFACKLGLYGGKPYVGNCLTCVRDGNNNPAFATALFGARTITHPPTQPAVSGCCDPVNP